MYKVWEGNRLRYRNDADMLVGYETQQGSWGYLVQRASHLNLNLQLQLSRITGFGVTFVTLLH